MHACMRTHAIMILSAHACLHRCTHARVPQNLPVRANAHAHNHTPSHAMFAQEATILALRKEVSQLRAQLAKAKEAAGPLASLSAQQLQDLEVGGSVSAEVAPTTSICLLGAPALRPHPPPWSAERPTHMLTCGQTRHTLR